MTDRPKADRRRLVEGRLGRALTTRLSQGCAQTSFQTYLRRSRSYSSFASPDCCPEQWRLEVGPRQSATRDLFDLHTLCQQSIGTSAANRRCFPQIASSLFPRRRGRPFFVALCTFFNSSLASLRLGVGGECPSGCWLIRLACSWQAACDSSSPRGRGRRRPPARCHPGGGGFDPGNAGGDSHRGGGAAPHPSDPEQFQGDKKNVADVLKISLKTLFNRLREYKADQPRLVVGICLSGDDIQRRPVGNGPGPIVPYLGPRSYGPFSR